jgi:hypothetical protein
MAVNPFEVSKAEVRSLSRETTNEGKEGILCFRLPFAKDHISKPRMPQPIARAVFQKNSILQSG